MFAVMQSNQKVVTQLYSIIIEFENVAIYNMKEIMVQVQLMMHYMIE